MFKPDWEVIYRDNDGDSTARMMVPGGWLVKVVESGIPAVDGARVYAVSAVFVADPDRSWILEGDDA